jgi:hypothetical protein
LLGIPLVASAVASFLRPGVVPSSSSALVLVVLLLLLPVVLVVFVHRLWLWRRLHSRVRRVPKTALHQAQLVLVGDHVALKFLGDPHEHLQQAKVLRTLRTPLFRAILFDLKHHHCTVPKSKYMNAKM